MQTAIELRRRGHEVTVLCRASAAWAEAAGATPLEMPHDLSLPAVLRLAAALRSARAQVVVCCTQRALRLGGPAARLAGAAPVIFRNGLAGSFGDDFHNRVVGRSTARFVANAEALAAEMAEIPWVGRERVAVLRNGVDTESFRPAIPRDQAERSAVRRRWGVSPKAPVVLAAGRFVEEKGFSLLLEAVARAARSVPDLHLVLLGDGPRRAALRCQAASSRAGILVPGFETDMPAAFRAADLYCQASQREGLSNATLEAMASGLPVVATDVDGTREAVRDGESGLLVPPGDAGALASALERLVSDPARATGIGAAGRRRVEEAFSLPASVAAWEALLAEVCAEARPERRPRFPVSAQTPGPSVPSPARPLPR